MQFEPGSKYQYSNAGINTAGRIIEVVSGMPYEDFLEKRLFEPLGMKDTTFWPSEEQLKRLAKSYKPNADKTGLEETTISAAQVSAQRPQAAADARRRPVLDGRRRRPLLPDGAQRRHLRGASATSPRKPVKQMTSKQTGDWKHYGFGWSARRRLWPRRRFSTDMTINRQRGWSWCTSLTARRLPQPRRGQTDPADLSQGGTRQYGE